MALIALALSSLAQGLALPTLALVVSERGLSLVHLARALFIYAASVIVFEVPSGMYADRRGRRRSYIRSMVFCICGTGLLFFSSKILVYLGFALSGIGRAYGSGSLDAAIIEQGSRPVEDLVFALEATTTLSLALGSLAAGLLLLASEGLGYVLVVRLGLYGLALLVAVPAVKGDHGPSVPVSISSQLKQMGSAIIASRTLKTIVLLTVVQGFALSSLEGYWQLFFKDLATTKLYLIGPLASAIFVIGIVGSLLARSVVRSIGARATASLCFFTLFVLQIALSYATTAVVFATILLVIYLVLGSLSLTMSTMLNVEVDNQRRATFIGVVSLTIQVGALGANGVASMVIGRWAVGGYWRIIASVGVAATLALLWVWRRR